jgi:IrrE N-terminal-like domain
MRRGFKAAADRHAADLREAVNCSEYKTIDLPRVARYLKVTVLAADKVLGSLEPLQTLHKEQEGAFSAATFVIHGRTVVVYNPIDFNGRYITPVEAKHDGRTRSNVAHEFSHLVLGHQVREVQQIAGHSFFTCNAEQEAEANWLAACMLLPRRLLLAAAYRGDTDDEIARDQRVTKDMAAFRMNTSGVRMQVARTRTRESR